MSPLLLFKNLLFTVLVPGTFGVYLPMVIAGRTGARAAGVGPFWLLGLVLLATGSLIYMVCIVEFATRGRGTPAPIDPPRTLVVTGLYRYVRNPMYLGVLSVVLGWAALTRSPALLLYAAALWTMFQLVIILYEEPTLRRLFGEAYQRYCHQVGRWIPGKGLAQ
ncbi:MAG TPA: isoprenylcysteine carboxylmethyltransferase family protein [Gemmatimonadales bacterium]|jgi:protein-S-isoprenylcysteine O-methyltransferase Ste14